MGLARNYRGGGWQRPKGKGKGKEGKGKGKGKGKGEEKEARQEERQAKAKAKDLGSEAAGIVGVPTMQLFAHKRARDNPKALTHLKKLGKKVAIYSPEQMLLAQYGN